jgi:hypothetical protein
MNPDVEHGLIWLAEEALYAPVRQSQTKTVTH